MLTNTQLNFKYIMVAPLGCGSKSKTFNYNNTRYYSTMARNKNYIVIRQKK